MRTAIIITGNVATGKSTLSKAFIERNPRFQHVVMDSVRERIANRYRNVPFSHKMEKEAQDVVRDMLGLFENVVFECVGYGEFSRKMIRKIEDEFDQIHRFHIELDLRQTQVRLLERQRISGYVPHPNRGDVIDYSEKVHSYYLMVNQKCAVLDGHKKTEMLVNQMIAAYEQNRN